MCKMLRELSRRSRSRTNWEFLCTGVWLLVVAVLLAGLYSTVSFVATAVLFKPLKIDRLMSMKVLFGVCLGVVVVMHLASQGCRACQIRGCHLECHPFSLASASKGPVHLLIRRVPGLSEEFPSWTERLVHGMQQHFAAVSGQLSPSTTATLSVNVRGPFGSAFSSGLQNHKGKRPLVLCGGGFGVPSVISASGDLGSKTGT